MAMKATSLLLLCGIILTEGVPTKENEGQETTEGIQVVESTTKVTEPWSKQDWKIRLPFAGAQCSCVDQRCSCCANIRVPGIEYDREACAAFNYKPNSNNVGLQVSVTNSSISRTATFDLRDNRPLCVPITQLLPVGPVDFCIKFTDVKVAKQNLHFCMRMLTRVSEKPVFEMNFECMNMIISGASASPSKPEDDDKAPLPQPREPVANSTVEHVETTIQS